MLLHITIVSNCIRVSQLCAFCGRFTFWQAAQLQEASYTQGRFADYPGSGYYLDIIRAFPGSASDGGGGGNNASVGNGLVIEIVGMDDSLVSTAPHNVSLADVTSSLWIDAKTRAVFVDFSFYRRTHGSATVESGRL